MRIMEEVARQENPFTSNGSAIACKQREQSEINQHIIEFISRGGSIQVCDKPKNTLSEPEVTPHTDASTRKRIKPSLGELSPVTLVPYKNRATSKSKCGQNIRAYTDGETYWVQVGGIDLGKGQGWGHTRALEERDKYRAANGLPPADY